MAVSWCRVALGSVVGVLLLGLFAPAFAQSFTRWQEGSTLVVAEWAAAGSAQPYSAPPGTTHACSKFTPSNTGYPPSIAQWFEWDCFELGAGSEYELYAPESPTPFWVEGEGNVFWPTVGVEYEFWNANGGTDPGGEPEPGGGLDTATFEGWMRFLAGALGVLVFSGGFQVGKGVA